MIDRRGFGHYKGRMIPFVLTLAHHVHESGRPAVAAGETLAHAVDPAKTRPFIEWDALPPHVVVGRSMTAAGLLAAYNVSDHVPDAAYDDINDEMIRELAAAIHNAERKAVENGYVLIQLNRPWVEFADLPEQAQAGRKRQAFYLLQRFRFEPRQQTISGV